MSPRAAAAALLVVLLVAGCTRRAREAPPARDPGLGPATPARDAAAPGPGARLAPPPTVPPAVPVDAAVPPTEEVYPDRVIRVKGHTCQVFRRWIVRLTKNEMDGSHLEIRPLGPDPEAMCRSWRGASRYVIPSPHAWSSADGGQHRSGEVKLLGVLRDRLAMELVDSCSSVILLKDLRTGREEKVAELSPRAELVYEGDGYFAFWHVALTEEEWKRALPSPEESETSPPGAELWTRLAHLKGRFPAAYRGLKPPLCPEVHRPPQGDDPECGPDWFARFRLDVRTGLLHRLPELRCGCASGASC